jgi:hypothetical protein
MNKITRYVNGMMVGMCGEYLYRVGYSIFPVIIICALVVGMLIDIFLDKEK